MPTYLEWLCQQTPEHALLSTVFGQFCVVLGEMQRTAPNAKETKDAEALVREYYQTTKGT